MCPDNSPQLLRYLFGICLCSKLIDLSNISNGQFPLFSLFWWPLLLPYQRLKSNQLIGGPKKTVNAHGSLNIYNVYCKFSKIYNISLFVLRLHVGYQGWNSSSACQNSKQGRPWSDCYIISSLIWVFTVCLLSSKKGLFTDNECSEF